MKTTNTTDYIICPHCKGEKGWNELITPEWMDPPEYQWNICRTCNGKGEITQLQAAVYKARGGPTPIQFTSG